jgi:hypothetical protein
MTTIKLDPDVATDLYAASGIVAGTPVFVTCTGGQFRLSSSQAGLGNNWVPLNEGEQANNKSGAVGAWAISYTGAGVTIEEA